jgi:hypothetical protein
MTATIKPPDSRGGPRNRALRFSSLESLGFSDSPHTWSDSPHVNLEPQQQVVVSKPDPFAGWEPTGEVDRLNGRSFRWTILLVVMIMGGAAGLFGWWLYQQPASVAEAASKTVVAQAETLDAALPALEKSNTALVTADQTIDTAGLAEVDAAARTLFTSSGELPSSEMDTRSAAASAASSALDAVRLVSDGRAYRMAVAPLLVAPELETDPAIIELDEAARSFGEWQLFFDDVRGALPDNVFPDVTFQLDVVSADLPSILTDYVDALREDDGSAANAVLIALANRLQEVEASLDTAIEDLQERVNARIDEADSSLAQLLTTAIP